MIFHTNGNQKKAGVAILIPDKIDFKVKTITRDREGKEASKEYIIKEVTSAGSLSLLPV